MTDHARLDAELNQTVLEGQIMAAFEKYYAEDCVMAENGNEPTRGKDANRKREQEFVDSIAEFHSAELAASAFTDDVSFSEWILDVTFQGGHRKTLHQVAVRRWKDGQVSHERFFYDSAA